MSRFNSLLRKIHQGINKENIFIPLSHPRLGSLISIEKSMYHLIGGDPGTGKTAFVDKTYVLDAYDFIINQNKVDFEVIYFSLERSREYKEAKWLAHRLYTENEILIDVPSILGSGTASKELTPEILQAIDSHKEYFDNLWKKVRIIDDKQNPTGIYKILKQHALENGTFYGINLEGKYYKQTLQSWKENKIILINKEACPVELYDINEKQYVSDNPNRITVVIVDHIGKMKGERDYSEKQLLDKTSEYLSEARDSYKYFVVPISQFNRNNANIQRRIHTDLKPEEQDFKGSGNMYEDADAVLGLFNPHKHNLNKHYGYMINQTINSQGFSRFRSVSLLKNSYGMDNALMGFKFVGENGHFSELVKSTEMTSELYNNVKNA